MTHSRSNSDPKSQSSSGSGSKLSGADMYAQAINAQNRKQAQAGGSVAPSPAKPAVTQYPTAEQEKAELKRYQEAKRAVDRMQSTIDDPPPPALTAPVAYESLYPGTTRGAPAASSSHPPPPSADAPPPFESAAGGSNIMAHLSEKERLRRKYEAQDAAALARQNTKTAPPPAAYSPPAPVPAPTPPPALAGPLPGQYANALEEKEALRKKFEERDKATKAIPTSQPQPPPRANSVTSNPPASPKTNGGSSPRRTPSTNAGAGSRPTPVPPAAGSGSSRVLTAAEEKALLRAKFEARDSGNTRKSPPPPTIPNGSASAVTNGTTSPTVTTPSTPPPLKPRPPVEYIKETQEEDARLSRLNGQMPILDGSPLPRSNSVSSSSPPSAVALDMKPFTPFRAGFDTSLPGPPPPLPHQ